MFLQLYQCEIVNNHIYDEYLYKWLILLIIVMQSLLQYYEVFFVNFVFNQEYTLVSLVCEVCFYTLFIKQMFLVFCWYSKIFIDGACYKFDCLSV